ncbi:MAG: Rha family transcriptional regulator [Cellulosilyticaceae bacterium]
MKNEVATLSVPVGDDFHLQTENGQVTVSSRYIAERFGKEHYHVLRDIENIKASGGIQNWGDLFIETQYQHEQNKQWYKEYKMTRDGFSLLAMGFTGVDALRWKLKYIEAFNNMEAYIREQKPLLDYNAELQEFDKTARIIGLSKNDKLLAVFSLMKKHNVPTLGLEEVLAYKMPKEIERKDCDKEALEYITEHDPLGFPLKDYYKNYLVHCARNGITILEKYPFCKAVRQFGYEGRSRRVDGESCKVWLERR